MTKQKNIHILLLLVIGISFASGCQPQPTATPTPTPSATASPTPDAPTPTPVPPPADVRVRLAWFYKTPLEGSIADLVPAFQFFILTRGDEVARDQLLAMGAPPPILQYVRFEAIHDPGDCQKLPRKNQVAYQPGDFCRIYRDHPDWFLLDSSSQRIVKYDGENRYVLMDPGNPGWRAFFLERVRENQMNANWGGLFLDNVEASLAFHDHDGNTLKNYADENAFRAVIQEFLGYLSQEFFQPNHKLLFANIVARNDESTWTTQLTHLDGAMHEGWAIDWPDRYRPPEIWELQMKLAEDTQAMGKFIILVSHGTFNDYELQQFAFASYLLVNDGRAAFRYGDSDHYREIWLYDNYREELGEPLGKRYQDGDAWRRDFTHGSVMVNPVTHESLITVK